jgi:hypothetical protein
MVADEGIKSRQNSSIGGKKKMQKTIRGRGEKEGKKVKNNNDANPIE